MVSDLGLCVDVICMSRTQRVVDDDSHTAYHQTSYFDLAVLLDEATRTKNLHDRVHETGSTAVLRKQVVSGCLFLQI